jgi:hypothetical protein
MAGYNKHDMLIYVNRLPNGEFSIDEVTLRWLLQTARQSVTNDIAKINDPGAITVASLNELVGNIDYSISKLNEIVD